MGQVPYNSYCGYLHKWWESGGAAPSYYWPSYNLHSVSTTSSYTYYWSGNTTGIHATIQRPTRHSDDNCTTTVSGSPCSDLVPLDDAVIEHHNNEDDEDDNDEDHTGLVRDGPIMHSIQYPPCFSCYRSCFNHLSTPTHIATTFSPQTTSVRNTQIQHIPHGCNVTALSNNDISTPRFRHACHWPSDSHSPAAVSAPPSHWWYWYLEEKGGRNYQIITAAIGHI